MQVRTGGIASPVGRPLESSGLCTQIVWRAVWGKSQRAKLICFAQLFSLFLTESRNSRGLSKLRNFVVSAQSLRRGAQLLRTQRNFRGPGATL
ncbi:hypothetical protein FA13DRAFT_1393057 [Coprinellus micaceus]|uniref:Uncharacterized protein n=1 Tax=Coprinellus micaceus TaxID=71717 RepID=A0A4Y7SRW8_COPMI|nr:hypothetical protein FA13DRAFT_1393057 [Coprinellus micaceus]